MMESKQLLAIFKKTDGKKITAVLFVVLQLSLAPFVHLAKGRANLLVSFISVCSCLLFAVFLMKGKDARKRFIAVALAFTVGADYGLVLLIASEAEASMYLFNIAQICYFLYLYLEEESRRERIIHLVARGTVLIVAVTAAFVILGEGADELSVISLIYYGNLLCNCAVAFFLYKKMPAFAIGLLLFVFCDLFVGFGNLSLYFDIERDSLLYSLMYPEVNMAWVFYLPSQSLIALHVAK